MFNATIKTLTEIRRQLPVNCEVLAVSKLQSVEKIRHLFQQGQRFFAENYVQEAIAKQQQLKDLNIEWHFIGRLQKNKVNQVVGHFSYIHSADSLALIKAVNQAAEKKNLVQKVFIQLNLSNEVTKAGILADQLPKILTQMSQFSHVQVVGLMTMPPLSEDPNQSRTYFRQLKSLLEQNQKICPSLEKLSMGTSTDFMVAAEEGASIVRLGTVLFGEKIK